MHLAPPHWRHFALLIPANCITYFRVCPNRFAKWAGSYRPSLENAGLTLPKPQALRGIEPGQPSNPTARERGLTGLKSAPAPAHLHQSYNPEAPPVQIPVPNRKLLEGCSNPSNPNP